MKLRKKRADARIPWTSHHPRLNPSEREFRYDAPPIRKRFAPLERKRWWIRHSGAAAAEPQVVELIHYKNTPLRETSEQILGFGGSVKVAMFHAKIALFEVPVLQSVVSCMCGPAS